MRKTYIYILAFLCISVNSFAQLKTSALKRLTVTDTSSVSREVGWLYFFTEDETWYLANGSSLVPLGGSGGGSGETEGVLADGSVPLTANWDSGDFSIAAGSFSTGGAMTGFGMSDTSIAGVTMGQAVTSPWLRLADLGHSSMIQFFPNGNISTTGSVTAANLLGAGDSTGTGTGSYRSGKAIDDTAGAIRSDFPTLDSVWVEAWVDTMWVGESQMWSATNPLPADTNSGSWTSQLFVDSTNLFWGQVNPDLGIDSETIATSEDNRIEGNIYIGTNKSLHLLYDWSSFRTAAKFNIGLGKDVFGDMLKNGDDNIGIGREALNSIDRMSNIVAIGRHAGHDLNDGYGEDVFIGSHTGATLTDGGYNTFVGPCAGYNIDQGIRSVALGSRAGEHSDGDFNVFIGYRARNTGGTNHSIHLGAESYPYNTNSWGYGEDSLLFIGKYDSPYQRADLHTGQTAFNIDSVADNTTYFIKNREGRDYTTFAAAENTWFSETDRVGGPRWYPTGSYTGTIERTYIVAIDSAIDGNEDGDLDDRYEGDDFVYHWCVNPEPGDTTWNHLCTFEADEADDNSFPLNHGVYVYTDSYWTYCDATGDTVTFTAYPQTRPVFELRKDDDVPFLTAESVSNGATFNNGVSILTSAQGASENAFVLGGTTISDTMKNDMHLYTGPIHQTIWNPTGLKDESDYTFTGDEGDHPAEFYGTYNSTENTDYRIRIDTLAHDTIPDWEWQWSTYPCRNVEQGSWAAEVAVCEFGYFTHGFTQDGIAKLITLDRTDSINVIYQIVDDDEINFIYLHEEGKANPYTTSNMFESGSPFADYDTDSVLVQRYVMDISTDGGSTWAVTDTSLLGDVEDYSWSSNAGSYQYDPIENIAYWTSAPNSASYEGLMFTGVDLGEGLKFLPVSESILMPDVYMADFSVGDTW